MPMQIPIAVMAIFSLVLSASPILAAEWPIAGKLLKIKTDKGAEKHLVLFKAVKQPTIDNIPDPQTGTTLQMHWTAGATNGGSDTITLDPSKWKGLGKPAGSKGWKYVDKNAARGGVKVFLIKPGGKGGTLKILAKGSSWAWALPGSPVDEVTLNVQIGGDTYCAAFASGSGDVKKNTAEGFLLVKDFPAPGSCTTSSPATFATIQEKIFTPKCATSGCHIGSSPSSSLDLSSGAAYADSVNVPSIQVPALKRIDSTNPDAGDSYLYLKLSGGSGMLFSQMPMGGSPLSSDCLDGLAAWIGDGAPETGNVAAADALLASCS